MNRKNEITANYLKALKKTIREKIKPYVKDENTSNNARTIRISMSDLNFRNIKQITYDASEIEPNLRFLEDNKNCHCNAQQDILLVSREFCDKYLRFFADFEKNKEEASRIRLTDKYTLLDLIESLHYDLFMWIASELLFVNPTVYSKRHIGYYYIFEDKKRQETLSGTNEGLLCTNNEWRKFRKKRNKITYRINSFPMPPHFLYVYSFYHIKKNNNKDDNVKLYSFLKSEDAYDKFNLDDYLKFEQEIIYKGIEAQRKGLFPKSDVVSSAFMNSLADVYIERVFGFALVKYAISTISDIPGQDAITVRANLECLKAVKSNDLFYSKMIFAEMVMDNKGYLSLFNTISALFVPVALKTLVQFINIKWKYKEIFAAVSTIYKDLFMNSDLIKRVEKYNVSACSLTDDSKTQIMKIIADPNYINLNS